MPIGNTPQRALLPWLVRPGQRADVSDKAAGAMPAVPGDKEATVAALARLKDELVDLQRRLWAEHKRALLVVLQAMDAAGKDGTIRAVFSGVNPHGVRVTSFKVPTEEELDHDFLWRVHAHTPGQGLIGVFNRSHYEDVLVVRVHDLVPKAVWKARYAQISAFEENLTAAGTVIVKVMLHVSKAEQAERLQARLDSPNDRWKFRAGDLDERAKWKDYMAAFRDAIEATTTDEAPWFIVPANRKWYRNWAVATILVEALRRIDPQYPPPDEALEGLVIT